VLIPLALLVVVAAVVGIIIYFVIRRVWLARAREGAVNFGQEVEETL